MEFLNKVFWEWVLPLTSLLFLVLVGKDLAFAFLARYLANSGTARNWIVKQARKRPDRRIVHLDSLYMERFWLVPLVMGFGIRLHIIHRPDASQDHHNHPGSFRTLILWGGYHEETDDGIFMWGAGDTYKVNRRHFHRIERLTSKGPTITLCILYRWGRTRWGFRLPDGSVVDHRDYIGYDK